MALYHIDYNNIMIIGIDPADDLFDYCQLVLSVSPEKYGYTTL
jgi:hypothetical protein